jgi:hypothetical protein
MLFGQPLFWSCPIELDKHGEEVYPDAYLELSDDSTDYGKLPDDVRDFINKCMMTHDGYRLWLVQLLQHPAVKQHLGWPEEWGVC